ncbi:MAG: RHS repeat domain-containing protein [Bacteroidales bacterium]
MQKTQSDVSIDAIASGFRFGFGEMAGISICWENAAACGFRVGIGEMGGISSRGGHVREFTYDYVKTHLEHPAPHDLSATQSEAPRSECVVIDVTKCDFQSGIGEMAGISFYLESAISSGFRYSIAEMASISSRGGHVRAFTYNYVKTRTEHPAPHDLSARLISQAQTSSFNFTNFTNLMTIASVLSKTSPALGSSSFITDATGYATQHLQYLPFGESWIDQQSGSFDTRYKFSAKELDDETQYSYFGARYYDSDFSVWLSVDPMSDDYPYQSPYMYCSGNPVMRIDPTGMNDGWVEGDGTGIYWDENVNSASEAEAMGLKYHGQTVIALHKNGQTVYGDSKGKIHLGVLLKPVEINDKLPEDYYLIKGFNNSEKPDFSGFSGFMTYLWTGGNLDGTHYDFNGDPMGPSPITGTPPIPSFSGGKLFIKGFGMVEKEMFHKVVKKKILTAAGKTNYQHIVGNNPDVIVKNGKIWLSGTESNFKGKEFETVLDALMFLF